MKFFSEMGPLLLFFVAYKFYGLIPATGVLIIATLFSVSIVYYLEKRIPIMPLASAIILGIFGGLTVFNGDEFFIKIKPTLVNILFAVILLGGFIKKKGLLKYLFDGALHMNDDAWLKFSLRWAVLFLFLAGTNEIVWRNFDTDFWVKFKVFGMLPITIMFMITQVPFLKRNMIEESKEKNDL